MLQALSLHLGLPNLFTLGPSAALFRQRPFVV